MPRSTDVDSEEFDHNIDRYPSFVPLLRRIASEADLPGEFVERLEVTCLANGDATWRVWTPRAEEPEGGFLPGAG